MEEEKKEKGLQIATIGHVGVGKMAAMELLLNKAMEGTDKTIIVVSGDSSINSVAISDVAESFVRNEPFILHALPRFEELFILDDDLNKGDFNRNFTPKRGKNHYSKKRKKR